MASLIGPLTLGRWSCQHDFPSRRALGWLVGRRGGVASQGIGRGHCPGEEEVQATENRYGPRYTSAMVGTAFVTFFLPIPAVSLLSVALIAVIAEIHRAISKRGECRQSPPC